jgi:hypothetical protein
VVRRSVTLDANEVSARSSSVDDRQIDDETRSSHLAMNFVAMSLKGVCNLLFEIRVVFFTSGFLGVEDTGGGITKEGFEGRRSARLCALKINVIGRDRAEDMTGIQSSRPESQAFLAIRSFDRPNR